MSPVCQVRPPSPVKNTRVPGEPAIQHRWLPSADGRDGQGLKIKMFGRSLGQARRRAIARCGPGRACAAPVRRRRPTSLRSGSTSRTRCSMRRPKSAVRAGSMPWRRTLAQGAGPSGQHAGQRIGKIAGQPTRAGRGRRPPGFSFAFGAGQRAPALSAILGREDADRKQGRRAGDRPAMLRDRKT